MASQDTPGFQFVNTESEQFRSANSLAGNYHIVLLAEAHARQILEWRYDAPYDFYNPPQERLNDEQYVREFLNPELRFHAVLDDDNRFVGFCSFGLDGQVPGGDYKRPALDIGVGMEPQYTGRGLGSAFFGSILKHVTTSIGASVARVTVADFNKRAIRLYRKFGFVKQSRFRHTGNRIDYTILIKEMS